MNVKAKIPTHFAYCPKSDCPKAKECLHHLACEQLSPNTKQVLCVNPIIAQQANEHGCSEWCEAKTVRMARGFIKALGTVPAAKVQEVAGRLIATFNRPYYYKMRKGEMPISPEQQQLINKVIADAGGKIPVKFDNYEDGYVIE
jgi:hypothetical protein